MTNVPVAARGCGDADALVTPVATSAIMLATSAVDANALTLVIRFMSPPKVVVEVCVLSRDYRRPLVQSSQMLF
jgi:hypothetical protein